MKKVPARYEVVEGSETGHDCCFGATVIDTTITYSNWVCECSNKEDADMICEALNFMYPLELK